MMSHLPNCSEQYYLRLYFLEICYSFSCSFPPIKGICSLSCSEVSRSYVLCMFLYCSFHFNLILWQGFNPSPLIYCFLLLF